MLIALLNGDISQDEYLRDNNVIVNIKSLPSKVYGFIYSQNDYNIIVINKCLSYYKRKKTLLHELAHLELCHVDKRKYLFEFNLDYTEDEADEYLKSLKQSIKDMKSI